MAMSPVAVGKASFDAGQLKENAEAVINEVARARPATAKGVFVESSHRGRLHVSRSVRRHLTLRRNHRLDPVEPIPGKQR